MCLSEGTINPKYTCLSDRRDQPASCATVFTPVFVQNQSKTTQALYQHVTRWYPPTAIIIGKHHDSCIRSSPNHFRFFILPPAHSTNVSAVSSASSGRPNASANLSPVHSSKRNLDHKLPLSSTSAKRILSGEEPCGLAQISTFSRRVCLTFRSFWHDPPFNFLPRHCKKRQSQQRPGFSAPCSAKNLSQPGRGFFGLSNLFHSVRPVLGGWRQRRHFRVHSARGSGCPF